MTSLARAFEQAVLCFGERQAVRDEGVTLSWTDLHQLSRRAASALLALGVAPGDRFGIWAVNQWRWIVAGLAGQAAGATLIPASTRLRPREIAAFLRRLRAVVLFCDPGFGEDEFVDAIAAEDLPDLRQIIVFAKVVAPSDPRVLSWADFLALAGSDDTDLDARIAATTGDSVADILFTSGTSGQPKGVPMTHAQSLIACTQQQSCATRFVPGDVFAVTYPFAHNAGYRAGWQAALLYGVTVIPVRNYGDPLDLLKLIEREKVTILPAVPTIFQDLLDHPALGDYSVASIRLAATGATTIPISLIERMQSLFGIGAVATGYGLTEAAGSVTNTRPGDSALTIATTTGRPLDNLEVKLIDPDGQEVAPGQPGEIIVRGPQVMHGYYDDDEATRAAMTDEGFLRTGDIGTFDTLGNLSITDRIKNMYLVGGFNVYPAEVEQMIRTINGVADVAIIGIADDRLGEVGRAFVVAAPGACLDATQILSWCRANMAKYKAPREIFFVPALPLNATGKVSRTALRSLAPAD